MLSCGARLRVFFYVALNPSLSQIHLRALSPDEIGKLQHRNIIEDRKDGAWTLVRSNTRPRYRWMGMKWTSDVRRFRVNWREEPKIVVSTFSFSGHVSASTSSRDFPRHSSTPLGRTRLESWQKMTALRPMRKAMSASRLLSRALSI